MRHLLTTLLVALLTLPLAACGSDDEDGGYTSAATTTQSAPSTTTQTTTGTTEDGGGKPPWDPPGYTFSGDKLQKCVKGKGLLAERETDPPTGDNVGTGIVHDRVLVGGAAGEPALRLFMFGAPDLAEEQGKDVTKRTPRAQVLGSVIVEPIAGDASNEEKVTLACLKQQAAAG